MPLPASSRIASFLADLPASLPAGALHAAKRLLLNGLRASLVSRSDPLSDAVLDTVTGPVGSRTAGAAAVGQARPLWSSRQASPQAAAFCNAFNWSLVLLDDMDLESGIHPAGPAAAAALALGESLGSSGADVLAAIVGGIEVQVAVARAAAPELLHERGFAPLTVVAPLGAVAAAVVLARPKPEVAVHAVGIAAMSGVGMWEQGGTASSLWLSGSATASGVAALAGASAGIDAPPRALDGEFGAFRAYCGKGPEVLAAHLDQLGQSFATTSVLIQPYSGDTYSQAPLECVRELSARFATEGPSGVDPAAPPGAAVGRAAGAGLERLVVHVDERTARGISAKHKRFARVTTALQANSDPPWRVAAAWLRGVYSYGPRFGELVADAEIAELRERVLFEHDPAIPDMSQAHLVAHLAGGHTVEASCAGFPGSSARPVSDDELAGWFRAAAEGVLAPGRAEAGIEAVWHLDEGDLGALSAALGDPAERRRTNLART